jgi:hypothetical protein
MKRSVVFYAVALGLLASLAVVLTNVVFPSPHESDDEYTGLYLVLYAAFFLSFAIGGVIAARRTDPLRSGALGGGVTALILLGMTFLTFVVVDNVFLDIVSQQIDKINAFHNQTDYTNMRDFINHGLLLGSVLALTVGTLFGGMLGALGAEARFRLARRFAAR